MAKEKKVRVRDSPKYSSSSDEESFDDEVDYSGLFKGLDRAKVEKINELIDALNEKDKLLEKQEDILYEEHDKFVTVKKSLALETKRNEMLSSELSTCHESVSSLKNLNDELNAKLEEANATRSCVEHVVICNRCKDFDVNACDEHLISIDKLNNEVASLNAQLKTCKVDFDKLKFAMDAYTVGRHPSIKDRLGFRKETKNLTSQRLSFSTRRKGRPLWLVVPKRIMPIFMIGNILGILIMMDVMIMLLIVIHMLCLPQDLLLFMVEVGLEEIVFCLMCLGKCAMNPLLFSCLQHFFCTFM
jgi:vacuolar-type H+-ATPase subunit I/STV1